LLKNIAGVFLLPLRAFKHRKRLHVNNDEFYIFLAGLSELNVPSTQSEGRRYDICNWYAHWKGRDAAIKRICHSANVTSTNCNNILVESLPEPYEMIRGLALWMRYLLWGILASLVAGFEMLAGRWSAALLLREAAMSKAFSLSNAPKAREYLFHYSGSVYRPLWTYRAEREGAQIISYFYSISEQPTLPSGYVPPLIELSLATWPTYFVWDAYQAEWVRSASKGSADIHIVGPIEFSDVPEALGAIPEGAVAVFDVSYYRLSVHMGFSTMGDFLAAHPDALHSFLSDCHRVTREMNVPMVLKTKRDIAHRSQTRYRKLVESTLTDRLIIAVNPAIAASRVVHQCKAVISVPFTSTALLVPGVPSAFYDPTGWIQKNDRAAHGIPILTGPNELRAWLSKTLG